MTTSVVAWNSGAKNIRPWMWSMWRWVRRMWMRSADVVIAKPRPRMPVPASSTSSLPSSRRTCTQEVLPP
jgi:hypothetical protein